MGGYFSREDEEKKRQEEEERKKAKEREEEKRRKAIEEEERRKAKEEAEQKKAKKNLHRLQKEMEVQSFAHSLSAHYYEYLSRNTFVACLIFGLTIACYMALVALGWEADVNTTLTSVAIGIGAVVILLVIQDYYRKVDYSSKMHYKAEKKCHSIAEIAGSACYSSESASSLNKTYDDLRKEEGNSSEIRTEQWAHDIASRKYK